MTDQPHSLRLARLDPPPNGGHRRPPPPWRRYSPKDLIRHQQLAFAREQAAHDDDEITQPLWQEMVRVLTALTGGGA